MCRRIAIDTRLGRSTANNYSAEKIECMRSFGIDIEWHSKGGSPGKNELDLDKYLKVYTEWHKNAQSSGFHTGGNAGTPALDDCSWFAYSLYTKVKTPSNGNRIDWGDEFNISTNEDTLMKLRKRHLVFTQRF